MLVAPAESANDPSPSSSPALRRPSSPISFAPRSEAKAGLYSGSRGAAALVESPVVTSTPAASASAISALRPVMALLRRLSDAKGCEPSDPRGLPRTESGREQHAVSVELDRHAFVGEADPFLAPV